MTHRRTHISRYADPDAAPGLVASLARSTLVPSFSSTVLFDARVLGIPSAQVIAPCAKTIELASDPQKLHLERPLSPQLDTVLGVAPSRTISGFQAAACEWATLRPLLIG